MPRGRPRKIPVEPITADTKETLAWAVADQLHRYCGIPGCSAKIHLADATQLLVELRRKYPQYIRSE
jgi:hypothetical protein